MATAAAAVVAARQTRYIRAFRLAGAVDPQHARTLVELGQSDSRILKGLVRRGYIVALPDGRYYVDLERWAGRQRRARIALAIVFAAVFAGLIVALAVAGRG